MNRDELKKKTAERCEELRYVLQKKMPEGVEVVVGHSLLHDELAQVTVHKQMRLTDYVELGVDEDAGIRRWTIHVVAHTPQLLHETEGYLVFNEADRKIKRILE